MLNFSQSIILNLILIITIYSSVSGVDALSVRNFFFIEQNRNNFYNMLAIIVYRFNKIDNPSNENLRIEALKFFVE